MSDTAKTLAKELVRVLYDDQMSTVVDMAERDDDGAAGWYDDLMGVQARTLAKLLLEVLA